MSRGPELNVQMMTSQNSNSTVYDDVTKQCFYCLSMTTYRAVKRDGAYLDDTDKMSNPNRSDIADSCRAVTKR